jgi:AcrR family transcriptional regulator
MAATIELLGERSAAAISVRDIAARAGVQHSLVFRHFGDKDTLLRDSLEWYFEAMEEQVLSFRDLPDAIEQILGMATTAEPLAMARACLDEIAFPASIAVPALTSRLMGHVADAQRASGGTPRFDERVLTMALLDLMGGMRVYRDLTRHAAEGLGMPVEELSAQMRELVVAFAVWAASATVEQD